MSDLPQGWNWCSLGELGYWSSGGTPSRRNPDYFGGEIHWIKSGDLPDGPILYTDETITALGLQNSAAKLLPINTICIALYGATIGKLGITTFEAATNQAVANLVPDQTLVHTKYVFYFLKSARQHFVELGQGGAQPNISQQIVRESIIPIAPINEQQRIADKLDVLLSRVDSCRERLDRVPAILRRFRQSVLAAATSGKLTKDWRAENKVEVFNGRQSTNQDILSFVLADRRSNWDSNKKYTEPQPVEIDDNLELPDAWSWVSWEMVTAPSDGAFKRGPFGSSLKKSMFVKKGYKVYEQYCPINDDCSFARYYIDAEKFDQLRSFEVKASDFLISCSGVTLGRITRVPNDHEPGIINQALLRVRLNERVIDPRYFIYLFRSPYFQHAIFENSTGSAIPNVKGVSELKAMPLPLPSLKEQLEIIRMVDELLVIADAIETRYVAASKHVHKLTLALFAKAFRGELVPQVPNDEPASELLKRIQAKREAQSTPKKKAVKQKATL